VRDLITYIRDTITQLGDTVKYFAYAVSMDSDERAGRMTVPRALGHLRVALDDAYTRASRDLGLTAQQAELICAAMRPIAVGDLARALRCDRSNVSRLVDRAAQHDLLRRRGGEADGRVTLIELSPRGHRLAEEFIERLEAVTRALTERWTGEHEMAAIEILTEVAQAIDAAGAPALSSGAQTPATRRARP
jgi:DNA-binding MarR family transcriptional regulator